jgi:hypothetical protein
MSEENRNALRCGYESETGKRHWENPVCHGEIAYASHAYQLFLEDLVISCEEELRRAHEEHDKLCDSLALVNEKDAEIERLKKDLAAAYFLFDECKAELTRLKAGEREYKSSCEELRSKIISLEMENDDLVRDARLGERELLEEAFEAGKVFAGAHISGLINLYPTPDFAEWYASRNQKEGEKG